MRFGLTDISTELISTVIDYEYGCAERVRMGVELDIESYVSFLYGGVSLVSCMAEFVSFLYGGVSWGDPRNF